MWNLDLQDKCTHAHTCIYEREKGHGYISGPVSGDYVEEGEEKRMLESENYGNTEPEYEDSLTQRTASC
jgi:hypothetical protein